MQLPLPPRRRIRPSVLYPGTPVVLMTTVNPDGSANISPLSSFWSLGQRIVLGLGKDGQGTTNLAARGECVLNFPSAGQAGAVEAIARATGRSPVPAAKRNLGYLHVRDKFAMAGFTPEASAEVTAPAIAECPLQVEAGLLAMHVPHGGTAQSFVIAECEIRCVHAHASITIEHTDHIDVRSWRPLIYVFRHYMGGGDPVARSFRAEA